MTTLKIEENNLIVLENKMEKQPFIHANLQYLQDSFINFIKNIQQKKILDVGCGRRSYEKFIDKSNNYIGLEVDLENKETNKLADEFYNGIDLPYENDHFDILLCMQVLEHAIDSEKLISEFYRVLKPEGIVYITVPFIWGEHEIPYDFRRYTSFGIKKSLEDAGFKITTFSKECIGSDLLKMIIKSEMTNYDYEYRQDIPPIEKKEIFRLFNEAFKLLDKHYELKRIYQNNLIIANK